MRLGEYETPSAETVRVRDPLQYLEHSIEAGQEWACPVLRIEAARLNGLQLSHQRICVQLLRVMKHPIRTKASRACPQC